MAGPGNETGKGTQTGSAGSSAVPPAGNDPFGVAEWMKDMPKVPLHPLMQHPAAAMAAATAIGFGVTSQIAGFMLGAMQGLAQTAQKTGIAADENQAGTVAKPVETPVAAVKPQPVVKSAPPVKAKVAAKVKVAAKTPPVGETPAVAEPVAVAPVRAEKPKRQKAALVAETQADDLKRISGIGPKLEQVLNGMGVRRYADVALWSDKDVQRFDDALGFAGRIARDGWVEQAKALIKG
jgi:NADH-quinone oxidoreductase subunit E